MLWRGEPACLDSRAGDDGAGRDDHGNHSAHNADSDDDPGEHDILPVGAEADHDRADHDGADDDDDDSGLRRQRA